MAIARCLINVGRSGSPPPAKSTESALSRRCETNESLPTPAFCEGCLSTDASHGNGTHQAAHCSVVQHVDVTLEEGSRVGSILLEARAREPRGEVEQAWHCFNGETTRNRYRLPDRVHLLESFEVFVVGFEDIDAIRNTQQDRSECTAASPR